MDVAIVGGGMAGAVTALTLQAAGHDVRVVERRRQGGTTLCGEGVSHRALRLLAPVFDATPFIDTTFEGVRWTFPGTTVHVHRGCHTMAREAWIPSMLEAVADRGGTVEFGRSSDGTDIDADLLVGADGPGSRVRKALGFPRLDIFSGMQMIVQRDGPAPKQLVFATSKRWSDEYAWRFSRAEADNVGLLMRGDGRDRDRLHAFVDHLGLDGGRGRAHIYPIATGGLHHAARNTVLMGDAAGLTNAVTKGGIAAIIHAARILATTARHGPAAYERALLRHPLTDHVYRRAMRRLRRWDDSTMRRLLRRTPTIHIGGKTPTSPFKAATPLALRAPWRLPAMRDLHRAAARSLHWAW